MEPYGGYMNVLIVVSAALLLIVTGLAKNQLVWRTAPAPDQGLPAQAVSGPEPASVKPAPFAAPASAAESFDGARPSRCSSCFARQRGRASHRSSRDSGNENDDHRGRKERGDLKQDEDWVASMQGQGADHDAARDATSTTRAS